MDKYLNKEAVELKLREIKAKYIDCLDFLTWFDSLVSTIEIESDNVDVFAKLLSDQESRKGSIEKIYADLPLKYEYFANMIGQEVTQEEIDGIRVQLIDATVIDNKIAELELKYVECLGFNFSYDKIVSYNDPKKDGENIKNLESQKKKNDIAFTDIQKKLDLFYKLKSSI